MLHGQHKHANILVANGFETMWNIWELNLLLLSLNRYHPRTRWPCWEQTWLKCAIWEVPSDMMSSQRTLSGISPRRTNCKWLSRSQMTQCKYRVFQIQDILVASVLYSLSEIHTLNMIWKMLKILINFQSSILEEYDIRKCQDNYCLNSIL